ncbi:MAG: S24/S26 family peptidase [archaeon]
MKRGSPKAFPLRHGSKVVVRCTGKSMLPAIKEGQLLEVRKKPLREGDVVVLLDRRRVLCHRLIMMSGAKYYTKGDNSAHPDHPLLKQRIIGTVVMAKDPRIRGSRWMAVKRMSFAGRWLCKSYLLAYLSFQKIISADPLKPFLHKPLSCLNRMASSILAKISR